MSYPSQTDFTDTHQIARDLWTRLKDSTLPQSARDKAADEFFWMWHKLSLSYGHQILKNWGSNEEDIEQTCYVALLEARDVWNPDRGPFPMILHFYVRNALREWLRMQDMIVRSHKAFQLCYARKQDVASEGTDAHEKIDVISFHNSRDDSEAAMEIRDESSEFSEKLSLQIAVRQITERLPMHQRRIVTAYYGLDSDDPSPLRETATKVGMSHESVRRFLNIANESMRNSLQGCV